jgi:hypothetical protein
LGVRVEPFKIRLRRLAKGASTLIIMVQLEDAGAHGPGAQQACSHRRLAVCALAVATVAAVVAGSASLLGAPAPRPGALQLPAGGHGIRIVHLPGGKVEMEFASARQQQSPPPQVQLAGAFYGPYSGGDLGAERGPSAGFIPESPAMRQAYRFAEDNRPSTSRTFDRRSYGVEQNGLRGRSWNRAATRSEGATDKEYKSLQAQLAAIHKDQTQQAKASQAEEAQLSAFEESPSLLSNELMQEGAGVIVKQAKAERAHMTAIMKSKATAALRAKKSGRSAELNAKAAALRAAESNVLKSSAARLEAPARMMSLAEEPAAEPTADSTVAPGEGGKIQAAIPPVPSGGDGCAGGVLCAIPTNNVAIQALEARLQADEIAISTLTRDVHELTKQTEELQKPLPLPAGAKAA